MAKKISTGKEAGAAKEAASKQVFDIVLPAETIALIEKQVKGWNSKAAAELRFVADGETRAKFKVAAYSYRGDTCCA